MGINTSTCGLAPSEEAFLQALLWEEGHLLNGPATLAAKAHGLSLLRCLEPANRLSPNLHGEALNPPERRLLSGGRVALERSKRRRSAAPALDATGRLRRGRSEG